MTSFSLVFTKAPVIIPALAFYFYIHRRGIFSAATRSIRLVLNSNYIVGIVYFCAREHLGNTILTGDSSVKYLINIILPRISYTLFILNAVLIYKEPTSSLTPTKRVLAQIFSANISLLLIINRHAYYLCLAFHVIVNELITFARLQRTLADPAFYSVLCGVFQFFFLISGK